MILSKFDARRSIVPRSVPVPANLWDNLLYGNLPRTYFPNASEGRDAIGTNRFAENGIV